MEKFAYVLLVLFWALIVFIVMGIVVLINDIGPKVKIELTKDGRGEVYIRKGIFYKWKIIGSYADPMMAMMVMENIKKRLKKGMC